MAVAYAVTVDDGNKDEEEETDTKSGARSKTLQVLCASSDRDLSMLTHNIQFTVFYFVVHSVYVSSVPWRVYKTLCF